MAETRRIISGIKPHPVKSSSTDQDKATDAILDKLKQRVKRVGYGSLICEIHVHQGKIKQVDITTVKERMRAD